MLYYEAYFLGYFLGHCMHIDFVIVAIFFPEILQNTDVLLLLHKIRGGAHVPSYQSPIFYGNDKS